MPWKITDIECQFVVARGLKQDATSSSQDNIVVLVHTDEEIAGLGETDNHSGLQRSDEEMTQIVHACREAVGPDFTMMVDVQYRWSDVCSCLRTVRKWGDLDLFILEAPLQINDLDGYAVLALEAPMRIAAA